MCVTKMGLASRWRAFRKKRAAKREAKLSASSEEAEAAVTTVTNEAALDLKRGQVWEKFAGQHETYLVPEEVETMCGELGFSCDSVRSSCAQF